MYIHGIYIDLMRLFVSIHVARTSGQWGEKYLLKSIKYPHFQRNFTYTIIDIL